MPPTCPGRRPPSCDDRLELGQQRIIDAMAPSVHVAHVGGTTGGTPGVGDLLSREGLRSASSDQPACMPGRRQKNAEVLAARPHSHNDRTVWFAGRPSRCLPRPGLVCRSREPMNLVQVTSPATVGHPKQVSPVVCRSRCRASDGSAHLMVSVHKRFPSTVRVRVAQNRSDHPRRNSWPRSRRTPSHGADEDSTEGARTSPIVQRRPPWPEELKA